MEILRAANAEIAMRRILQAAVSEKASDVHLEPCREFVLVRFRIDGTLTERYRLPPDMAAGLSVRAKVLGGMDVGENRIPQDGSFSEIRDEKNTDFRLSVMPSVYGETIVIRILSGQMDFRRFISPCLTPAAMTQRLSSRNFFPFKTATDR